MIFSVNRQNKLIWLFLIFVYGLDVKISESLVMNSNLSCEYSGWRTPAHPSLEIKSTQIVIQHHRIRISCFMLKKKKEFRVLCWKINWISCFDFFNNVKSFDPFDNEKLVDPFDNEFMLQKVSKPWSKLTFNQIWLGVVRTTLFHTT